MLMSILLSVPVRSKYRGSAESNKKSCSPTRIRVGASTRAAYSLFQPHAGALLTRSIPSGDFPVAYDLRNGVFLIIPAGVACVYDVGSNRYRRLPEADIQIGMNYMLAYDIYHEIFLLVTGTWRRPPVVWALKLDLTVL